MHILIYSPVFYPSIGGLETVVEILAREFVSYGHQVKLVSQTPATTSKFFPFEIIRKPSPLKLLNLVHWCDVYFQPNISLKGIWPLLFVPKHWVVSHNSWYTRPQGNRSWQDHLKQFALRFATGISVSQAIAEQVSAPSVVIPNPYRDDIFYEIPDIPRDKELVFLGRLVSDKGVDLLLEALAKLKQLNITPRLTIVGSGPEESQLRQQAKISGIFDRVTFVGTKVEKELVQLLNAHQILVIPSRWQEPFGVVALEGIACGCIIIGSDRGGLKNAIGACGVTFPNGDVEQLTAALKDLLVNPNKIAAYRLSAKSHLLHHQASAVAQAYLQVFERAIS
jgi:glycogen(starch) synthase